MSLPTQKLDDRTWESLVEEAKRRIAAKCPAWTDFNPSDPGMTLVELMAWMTETTLYSLNRVPEKNYIKFLELIGLRLQPARPARTWVFFQIQSGVNEETLSPIPQFTRVSSRPQPDQEPIPFVTCQPLNLTTAKIIKTCSRYGSTPADGPGAVVGQVEEPHSLCGENPWETEIFHRARTDPPQGKAVPHNLYLGDSALGDLLFRFWPHVKLDVLAEVEQPMKGQLFLEWEAWDGKEWQKVVPDVDTSFGFRRNVLEPPALGRVTFESLPMMALEKRDLAQLAQGSLAAPAGVPCNEENTSWLRARLIGSEVETLPTLGGVQCQITLKECVVPPLKAFAEMPPTEKLAKAVAENLPSPPPPPPLQPLESSRDFYPFGTKVVQGSTFYLASELFQKHGAAITIQFGLRKSLQPKNSEGLEIHWEYKPRAGAWRTLGKSTSNGVTGPDSGYEFKDYTNALTQDGKIMFICPKDLDQTEVGGQTSWFVRARVERAEFERDSDPQLKAHSVLLGFTDKVRDWTHCLSENYSKFEVHAPSSPFRPFYIEAQQDPAFYMCFDPRPSPGRGRYRLFLDVVPQEFKPSATSMKWEYSSSSAPGGWKTLEIEDGTAGFAHKGTVDFISPVDWDDKDKSTTPAPAGYWLRVRWEIAEFCKPPRLRRVLLNGVEVVQAVPAEWVLGSSNGTPDQCFPLHTSILEYPELLVREEADGRWVKWTEVRNFFHSRADDQHFTVDLGTGTFVFGDGMRGRIPPMGKDNIAARFRVTKGSQGNIGSNTITVLEASLSQVKGISNVHPAEGGCDREDIESAKKRGPWEIRHRDRAVTEEDFIRLAQKASPLVGKAECYEENGLIHVVLVPKDGGEKPQPSRGLVQVVFAYLDARRLINTRIKVQGPVYEAIDLEVEVVLEPLFLGRFPEIKQEIERRLRSFVHPLTGMNDGSGWCMGRSLHLSEFYYRLEDIKGLDYTKLQICKSGTNQWTDKIEIVTRSFPCFSRMTITQSFS